VGFLFSTLESAALGKVSQCFSFYLKTIKGLCHQFVHAYLFGAGKALLLHEWCLILLVLQTVLG